MTNTERLIKDFEASQEHNLNCRFAVGRYTGNGIAVVAALPRRGYTVTKLRSSYFEITKA